MAADGPDDGELDLLLSRGRLKGPVAESLRDRVLEASAPARLPWWRRLHVLLPAVALAGLVLVAGLRAWRSEEWRSKGGGGGIGVELTCSGGTSAACPQGARLGVAFLGAP